MLTRCSPGLVPGSTTVSSGCMSMCPCFTTVKPGGARFTPVVPGSHRWRPGSSQWRHGSAPVFAGIETDSHRDDPGRHRGEPWQNSLSRLPRWRPGSPRWSTGEAPVCAGIALCRSNYPRFAQDHPGLSRSSPGSITVCHGVAPVEAGF